MSEYARGVALMSVSRAQPLTLRHPRLDSMVGGDPVGEVCSNSMENQNNQKKKKRRKKKKQEEEVILSNEPMCEDDGEQGDEESEEELRRKEPSGHQMDVVEARSAGPWPKCLIVAGQGLGGVSLLKSSRWLSEHVDGLTNVTRRAGGSLVVMVSSRQASDAVLALRELCECPIDVSPHWSFNSRRGVVRSLDLVGESEEDLLAELACEGVVGVKRITRKADGVDVPTPSIILTFRGDELPSNVRIGFLSVRVRPYVPNPLICFKCFRYGHTKARCRMKAICAKCGGADHTDDRQCERDARCRSCGGGHTALSHDCPVWLQEREVQRVVACQNVPFSEAVKRVANPPPVGGSFAQAVVGGGGLPRRVGESQPRSGTSDFATQTVEQRSIAVQVDPSALDALSEGAGADAPPLVDSWAQTKNTDYEFWCPSVGEWFLRRSCYIFEEHKLVYSETPYDDEDPFMGADGLVTALGGGSVDTTELRHKKEDVNVASDDESSENVMPDSASEDEKEKEDEPAPVFIADDGGVYESEEARNERNKFLVERGLKVLPCRSRSINRVPAPQTGRFTSRRKSRSPIRPPR